MKAEEKNQLTRITNLESFKKVFEKFIFGKSLNYEEKTYILSIALLSIKVYEKDKRKKSFLEFSYFIILNYSLKYHDYKPLYDFSVEYGFYPIVDEILKLELIETNIKDLFTKIGVQNFRNNNYIETIQQFNLRKNISRDENEIAIIAPTSFGKSEYILEHIEQNLECRKFAIIVPTKSLLVQTYNMIRKSKISMKIIYHDEMYDNDERFIAVLTQERALRLLDKENINFDVIYIDEAHNLLNRDLRSILLSRFLRINRLRNPKNKVVYLSPLIDDSNKLCIDRSQDIFENRIDMNLKHPEFLLKKYTDEYLYNRYSNKFYLNKECKEDYIKYIISNLKEKNFIYLRNPIHIEKFVKQLYEKSPDIELDAELNALITDLETGIHKEYWMIKLIKKGIVYLHGKIPDILKEYLEANFKKIAKLRIIVANHVILEGINLPIDNLFILTVRSLKPKDAINLIGRVNRLNNIFGSENNNLNKLIPRIYFLENEFNNVDLEKYIEKLRSNLFEEKVNNPTLINYDNSDADIEIKQKDYEINHIESFVIEEQEHNDELNEIYKVLYKNNIHNYIKFDENYVKRVLEQSKKKQDIEKDIVDLIFDFFLADIDYKIENDLLFYLKTYPNIRNYYKIFLHELKQYTLREYVAKRFRRIKTINNLKNGSNIIFIGTSFGEVNKYGSVSDNFRENKWVNLYNKTDSEIISFILIKYKLDSDFTSYDLNNFINALYDLNVLSEKEFNLFTYGTEDLKIIELKRLGISSNLINKINSDSKLSIFKFNEQKNLEKTDELLEYINSLNGIEKFEIEKFIK